MARVRKGGKWRSTKGSWYGGPRDAQDNDRPALQGATNKVPGIARFDRSTLGDTFEVRAPNGKTIRVRQTDIGPAPWTGKGLDVNYTAVKALGYTEGNFPTGAKLQYRRIGRGDQTSGGVAVARGGKRGKRGRTRSTGSDPDLTLAQQQATVQFGPEESQLQSLLKSAASNYEDDVTRAEEGAKATQLISRASRPRVKAIYAQSTKDTDTANQDVLTAFGKLGAAADPYRAVTARDMAGWKGRIASARSNSLQGLTDREIEAVAGKSQALQKATADYRGDVEKLSDRSTALGREKGAAMAAQLGAIKGKRAESAAELRKIRLQGQIDLNKEKMENASEAEQKRLDRENSVLIERMGNQTSRANAKTSAASKGGGSGSGLGGNKPASRSEIRGFHTDYARAVNFAKQLKGARRGATRQAVGSRIVDDGRVDDQLAISMALDTVFDGHVSRLNARKLKRAGLTVKGITGATSYEDWKKRATRGGARTGSLAGTTGSNRR